VTWTDAKEAAAGRWTVRTVWKWARSGYVAAKRTPGPRGRLLVAVDADGLPVFTTPQRARRRS